MQVDRILDQVVARFIGTKHERDVKRITPIVHKMNALESEMKQLPDSEFAARTLALKAEVAKRLAGAEPSESGYNEKLQVAFEGVMIPAFALVREAGRRTLNMRHFDVQLIGGIVLHEG